MEVIDRRRSNQQSAISTQPEKSTDAQPEQKPEEQQQEQQPEIPAHLLQATPLMTASEIQQKARSMMELYDQEYERWSYGDDAAGSVCECISFNMRHLTSQVTFWLSELAAQQAEINRRVMLAELNFQGQTQHVKRLEAENARLMGIIQQVQQQEANRILGSLNGGAPGNPVPVPGGRRRS